MTLYAIDYGDGLIPVESLDAAVYQSAALNALIKERFPDDEGFVCNIEEWTASPELHAKILQEIIAEEKERLSKITQH